MTPINLIADVSNRLRGRGFGGLFSRAGRCGCAVGDLAPCGETQKECCEEFINGCQAGYKHLDPRPGHVEYGDFVITDQKDPPGEDEFDNYYD